MELLVELNVALIPDDTLAARHVALSKELAKKYPALVQLNDIKPRLSLSPHLTLYQVALRVSELAKAHDVLTHITNDVTAPDLRCVGYAYNEGEGSFEVSYETTEQLLTFQNDILTAINPLRGTLLLERDPAGNNVRELLSRQDTLGDNIRHTGYAEVGNPRRGGLFRPHVTLNWFEPGVNISVNDNILPKPDTLHGRYPKLGLYLLGPYGTCPQRIAQYVL